MKSITLVGATIAAGCACLSFDKPPQFFVGVALSVVYLVAHMGFADGR